ncbi:MAG: prolyl oligopeptidase family serine peptidase [Thermoanaerobaculia bacterium]|nr:prolyl oligopeptidase family serine peptidase [Thermoanaerobaculia bacterium]
MVLATFFDRAVMLDGVTHRFKVWVPAGYTAAKKYAAVLFLHGAGERGDDNEKQIAVGVGPALRDGSIDIDAIVVFPQCPDDGYWVGPERHIAIAALDAAQREFSIDPNRISLTGMSMGGSGTWILAAEHPRRFSAIAPVCAWVGKAPKFRKVIEPAPWLAKASDPYAEVARRIGNIPVWVFHGALDDLVLPSESHEMMSRLGANAAYTEFPQANHNSWDPAYRTTGVMRWLVAQKRRK